MFRIVTCKYLSYNNRNGRNCQILLSEVNILKLLHENMVWKDTKKITKFTENTKENRNKLARTTSSLILAATQYMYNYIQGLKRLSVYDAASILNSDINWFKNLDRNTPQKCENSEESVTISSGKLYYINYGNSFKGELSYFHYGLCIGKKENKILVVPMRTGADIFGGSYHPVYNNRGKKKYRRCYPEEGFLKECTLLVNDTKYISCGRIIKEAGEIDKEVLEDIKMQVFSFQYPNIYQQFVNQQNKIIKMDKDMAEKKEEIIELKNRINLLEQKQKKFSIDK